MEPTNRAAITYYRTFKKAIEKIEEIDPVAKSGAYKSQLSILEINIKNIKKIEPNYDTSELESEIDLYKNKIDAQDKNKSLDKDLKEINKGIDFLFNILNETKFNTDNIDFQVKSSTESFIRDINIFKKNHPEYNLKFAEDKVIEFQNKFREKLEKSNQEKVKINDLDKDLKFVLYPDFLSYRDFEGEDYIYGTHNPTGDPYLPNYIWSGAGIDKLQSIMDSYPNRVTEFLTKYNIEELNGFYEINSQGNIEIQQDKLRDYKANTIKKHLSDYLNKADSSALNIAKEQLKGVQEVADFVVENYFNNKIEAYRWIFITQIFIKSSKLNEIAEVYKKVIDYYGSIEDYKNLIRQNSIKNAKKVSPPKAVKEDAEIESSLKIAFEQKGWNEEVLKVYLLSNDWRLERNSDFIIGRVYDAALVAKQKTGICMLYILTMRQEQIGDKFNTPFIDSYSSRAIAEENI